MQVWRVLLMQLVCGMALARVADGRRRRHNEEAVRERRLDYDYSRDADELRLLRYLMRNYSPSVRPVRNTTTPVVIKMGITLVQIFDVDEKNQVLTTTVWLDQEWKDEFMGWNPADFNEQQVFRVPCEYLWLPDIVLYNNADDYTNGYFQSKAMVTATGDVFWPPPTKFRSTCEIDVSYFPFDEQVCKMRFGSWSYDGFQVDVTNRSTSVDLTNYVENGEWELSAVTVKRNTVYYTCCPEPFPDVTFTIVIRRRILYYMYNVIFPCMMMSWLTLLVFCLPPDSGEKIALGITVLLAFSVFVLAIGEKMPETSNSVPLIGIYLTVVMGMTSVSVVMTVLVLNFHHRGPSRKPVPGWLRGLILNQLAMLVCFKPSYQPRYKSHRDLFYAQNTSNAVKMTIENFMDDCRLDCNNGDSPTTATTDCYNGVADGKTRNGNNTRNRQKSGSAGGSPFTQSNRLQEQILRSLQILIERQQMDDQIADVVNEWRQLAQVVDRFLFWIYLLATLSFTIGLLVIMPLTKEPFDPNKN